MRPERAVEAQVGVLGVHGLRQSALWGLPASPHARVGHRSCLMESRPCAPPPSLAVTMAPVTSPSGSE